VHEFLEAARELFELHIYTMGDKQYAAEIRRILDPVSVGKPVPLLDRT
jgi:RNA polymerase II C-terminal domain phosphatase-like 3/4